MKNNNQEAAIEAMQTSIDNLQKDASHIAERAKCLNNLLKSLKPEETRKEGKEAEEEEEVNRVKERIMSDCLDIINDSLVCKYEEGVRSDDSPKCHLAAFSLTILSKPVNFSFLVVGSEAVSLLEDYFSLMDDGKSADKQSGGHQAKALLKYNVCDDVDIEDINRKMNESVGRGYMTMYELYQASVCLVGDRPYGMDNMIEMIFDRYGDPGVGFFSLRLDVEGMEGKPCIIYNPMMEFSDKSEEEGGKSRFSIDLESPLHFLNRRSEVSPNSNSIVRAVAHTHLAADPGPFMKATTLGVNDVFKRRVVFVVDQCTPVLYIRSLDAFFYTNFLDADYLIGLGEDEDTTGSLYGALVTECDTNQFCAKAADPPIRPS